MELSEDTCWNSELKRAGALSSWLCVVVILKDIGYTLASNSYGIGDDKELRLLYSS